MRSMTILAVLLCGAPAVGAAGEKALGTGPSSSAEMTVIFEADQASRKDPEIDWVQVHEDDQKRRLQTQALLDDGKLSSGDDFYHAHSSFSMAIYPKIV